jgi:hypothetical protein
LEARDELVIGLPGVVSVEKTHRISCCFNTSKATVRSENLPVAEH